MEPDSDLRRIGAELDRLDVKADEILDVMRQRIRTMRWLIVAIMVVAVVNLVLVVLSWGHVVDPCSGVP